MMFDEEKKPANCSPVMKNQGVACGIPYRVVFMNGDVEQPLNMELASRSMSTTEMPVNILEQTTRDGGHVLNQQIMNQCSMHSWSVETGAFDRKKEFRNNFSDFLTKLNYVIVTGPVDQC